MDSLVRPMVTLLLYILLSIGIAVSLYMGTPKSKITRGTWALYLMAGLVCGIGATGIVIFHLGWFRT